MHTIKYALKQECIDAVYVSTNDSSIKEVSLKHGAFVIDRPEKLSGDFEPTITALKHALERLKEETIENVFLLQPTNPLRPRNLLREAFYVYENNNCSSLFTVTLNKNKLGRIIENKFLPFNYSIGQRSQDLTPLFFENGLLYITKANLITEGVIINQNSYPLVVNHLFGKVDIDTLEDFQLAEFIYKNYKDD